MLIKEGAFGGTNFRHTYSRANNKCYWKSWKKFDQLEDIDQKFYCSNYYDISVKFGTPLRFWENNGWINPIDPCGWFQWYFRYWFGRRSEDGERQIHRWKKIASRFKGKLVRMIRDAGGKFDYYSISPKIRQILLHWGYQLTEEDFFINSTN